MYGCKFDRKKRSTAASLCLLCSKISHLLKRNYEEVLESNSSCCGGTSNKKEKVGNPYIRESNTANNAACVLASTVQPDRVWVVAVDWGEGCTRSQWSAERELELSHPTPKLPGKDICTLGERAEVMRVDKAWRGARGWPGVLHLLHVIVPNITAKPGQLHWQMEHISATEELMCVLCLAPESGK